MAWYALYKWFRTFRKSPYVNYISVHKKFLYDQWFNGLSPVERIEEQMRIEKEKIAKRARAERALSVLCSMALYNQGRWSDPW